MDTLLRQIPKVDDLLRLPALNTLAAEVGAAAVTEAVRRTLDRRDRHRHRAVPGGYRLPGQDTVCQVL